MTNEEIKKELESKTPQELESIGLVRKETFDKVSKALVMTSEGLLDVIMQWAAQVVSEAEKSKSPNIVLFTKVHLTSLKNMISQKISGLKDNE